MNNLHDTIHRVTQRVIENSRDGRAAYLELMEREADNRPDRSQVSCSNLAHAYAGALEDQEALKAHRGPNIGIVTSYNDMLSAHQPYGRYPERLKIYAREVGATAQVAGATPVESAITSRLNRLSSMPVSPCVTPSHIAGVPPATCAVAPTSRA